MQRAFLHVRYCGLGEIEHRVNVDLEGVLPLLVGDVRDGLERRLVRRVVDENVDAAQFLHAALDNAAAMRRIADVARHKDRLASGLFDPALRLLGVLFLVQVGD